MSYGSGSHSSYWIYGLCCGKSEVRFLKLEHSMWYQDLRYKTDFGFCYKMKAPRLDKQPTWSMVSRIMTMTWASLSSVCLSSQGMKSWNRNLTTRHVVLCVGACMCVSLRVIMLLSWTVILNSIGCLGSYNWFMCFIWWEIFKAQ